MNQLNLLFADPPVSREIAEKSAAGFARRYQGRRGAMVVDVVASAARKYDRVELSIVPGFEQLVGGKGTLQDLATANPNLIKALGLRRNEPETMIEAAKGLIQFGSERNITG
ncbi:MAG: hypothetical protein WCP88_05100, partial [bacterium]